MEKYRLPKPIELGTFSNSHIGELITWRGVYKLPVWQRPFVWTEAQSVKLIESIFLGFNIGTYSINETDEALRNNSILILDGQQRITSIYKYIDNEFKVFGFFWNELNRREQTVFKRSAFGYYIMKSTDEQVLKRYYNLLNFGGTTHTKENRLDV